MQRVQGIISIKYLYRKVLLAACTVGCRKRTADSLDFLEPFFSRKREKQRERANTRHERREEYRRAEQRENQRRTTDEKKPAEKR